MQTVLTAPSRLNPKLNLYVEGGWQTVALALSLSHTHTYTRRAH